MILASELILNPDGSVYHLNLLPGQVAQKIITVGDPDRVDEVAKRLDSVEFSIQKREFKTVTGRLGDQRLTIISTGIGTDNIDIVFNELDALANIDFETRTVKEDLSTLQFIRIGTSGSLREDIDVDSFVVSAYAIGLEGLMHFYKYQSTIAEETINESAAYCLHELKGITPYTIAADKDLLAAASTFCRQGITVTATGFYGPQGRILRYDLKSGDFLDRIRNVKYGELLTTNLEMETSGIYGISKLLDHQAISLNAIMANRAMGTFSTQPQKTIDRLIDRTLQMILE
jgi:uridine phosphorylase